MNPSHKFRIWKAACPVCKAPNDGLHSETCVVGMMEDEIDRLTGARTEVENTPEGCTPADARVLREANGIFAEENHQLRRTLRFYAHGEHYTGLKHWEGPSGDDNWLCPPGEDFGDYRKQFIDALDEAMVEDGTLARSALRGVYLDMDGEPELAPVEGEPEWKIEQEAKALLSPQRQITPADAKTRHYLDGQNYDADPAFGDD